MGNSKSNSGVEEDGRRGMDREREGDEGQVEEGGGEGEWTMEGE